MLQDILEASKYDLVYCNTDEKIITRVNGAQSIPQLHCHVNLDDKRFYVEGKEYSRFGGFIKIYGRVLPKS